MIITDLAAAALTALLFSALFAALLRATGPKLTGRALGGLAALFCILFVATWAGGLWMPPLGPSAWGVPWLSFFVVGLMVAALVAASAGPQALPGRSGASAGEHERRVPIIMVVGTFFWLAIVLFLLLVVAAYATR